MSGNDQYGRRLFSWGKPLRFLASILYSEMRYLVYMRYLCTAPTTSSRSRCVPVYFLFGFVTVCALLLVCLFQNFCFETPDEGAGRRPSFRACKYILSPCNKTLFINVVFDQSISGIFWAVKSADKLIKAHCLPLD